VPIPKSILYHISVVISRWGPMQNDVVFVRRSPGIGNDGCERTWTSSP